VVSSEDAVFSGNTGTTIFDVSNPTSPNYSPLFSGFSGTVWTNPLFSATTSGLTLPITSLSAETQVVGPFWTLTQTGMTGDYVIGTQYTGYSVLDYKGPLDYISTKEDASVEGRLTTNKLTVTGGASSATTGYVLTQTGDTGEVGWVFNSASATTDTNLANSDLIQSAGTRFYQLPTGYRLAFNDNSNLAMLQFNENDPSVVVNNGLNSTDFQVKGQTDNNTFYVDASTDSVGIGTSTPTEKLHVNSGDILVTNTNGSLRTDIQNSGGPLTLLSGATTELTRFGVATPTYDAVTFGIRGASEPIASGYGKQGDAFIYSSVENNGFNIVSQPGTGTDDYVRFFVGQVAGASGTPDLYIQGSGTTRGNIGINNETPTSKLDILGTNGYQQLRLRTNYTPSSTADTNGEIGDIAWDNSYLYIKTGTGWGRLALDYVF
jgi:hypothetical protein